MPAHVISELELRDAVAIKPPRSISPGRDGGRYLVPNDGGAPGRAPRRGQALRLRW